MAFLSVEEAMEKIKIPKRPIEEYFRIYDRGSSWAAELRAGLVLFMTLCVHSCSLIL
eukprot:jgi/Botrbrau1/17563/Bobra.0166s0011.1